MFAQEIRSIAEDKARRTLGRAAAQLRSLLHASAVAEGHIRTLVWETETRLAHAGVPMLLLHPELDAPLGLQAGMAQHPALYADLVAAGEVNFRIRSPLSPPGALLPLTVALSAAGAVLTCAALRCLCP